MGYDKTSTTRVLKEPQKNNSPLLRGHVSQKLCAIGGSKCMSYIYVKVTYHAIYLTSVSPSPMFFLKLKRTLKTRVLQHLDPWFCQALWNKGPKRKRSKKEKKEEG